MNIQEFKKEVGGRFFTAVFLKKDGTLREMTCRFGVKKALKGGQLSYNPDDYNNMIVYDIDKKEYRTISVDRLVVLKYNGKEFVGRNALNKVLT